MKCSIEVNNQIENYELNTVAKQAAGAVLLQIKDTVLLATVARDDNIVEEDFLPLTVQYVEKTYAVGKIPGGYIKRETKPGDFETLTSRIIDRSLRPLFPKGYGYPTQIVVYVLSSDGEVDLQVAALNAASAALYLSDIPVKKPVAGVRIGKIDDEYIINPTNSQLEESSLDLYVAGSKEELLMIEMRAIATLENEVMPLGTIDPMIGAIGNITQNINELDEEEMIKAIDIANKAILNATNAYHEAFSDYVKEDADIILKEELENDSIFIYIDEFYKQEVKEAINHMAKSERSSFLQKIKNSILQDDLAIEEQWDEKLVESVLNSYKRKVVREQILNERKRADGRGLKGIRDIDIKTNILPKAHGSCLFTRGQTQALVIATIGGDSDAQMYDLLTKKETQSEKFMVNYNFPGFSVGEASPLRAPGRRELGHGNLAKRALAPSVDINSIYTLRLVSEILESNGSSSMATVCGGSLALRAAGINSSKLIAGVAMGMVFEDNKYAILTDIMGLEDHDGDMDFKVAGSIDGITALQMDIKLGGIEQKILKEALYQAKEAREHILAIMEEANENIQINEDNLPKFELFSVDPSKIVDIIGQAGKTIREIIEKFDVSVDLDRDKGEVKIAGDQKTKVEAAKNYIINITKKDKPRKGGKSFKDKKQNIPNFVIGEEIDGEVKKIVDFGAFVEISDGIDGLLHISKIAEEKVDKVDDYLKVGDKIKVKVLEQKNNKISLELVR